MNKCQFCAGKLKRAKVDIARYWGKELVALNNVPTLVCSKCGERFFEAKVSKKIDRKIQEVIESQTTIPKIDVPVVHF